MLEFDLVKRLPIYLGQYSINNFIPTIWSAQLLVTLRTALVYGQEGVINRSYEGEIANVGDSVKINGIGDVTIGDYTKNQSIGDPEILTDNSRTLVITESKFFNFQVDDIDTAQQNPKVMQEAMSNAGYGLQKVSDSFISGHYKNISVSNRIGTEASPIEFTKVTDAYEYLVNMSVLMDESDIPVVGRWVIVPPWYVGLLLKDDRFISSGDGTAERTRMNGDVGEAVGMRILKSNTVPNDGDGTHFRVIGGYRGGWTYAEQISSVEAYRPQNRFSDALKGLHLYGAKVIRPKGLVLLTVNRPSF